MMEGRRRKIKLGLRSAVDFFPPPIEIYSKQKCLGAWTALNEKNIDTYICMLEQCQASSVSLVLL